MGSGKARRRAERLANVQAPKAEEISTGDDAMVEVDLFVGESEPEPDAELPSAEPEHFEVPQGSPVWHVAPGRSITSRRGIISAGEPVRPKDVHGDAARLDELVAAGALVKSWA